MTQYQSISPFEWKVDDGTSSIKVIEAEEECEGSITSSLACMVCNKVQRKQSDL